MKKEDLIELKKRINALSKEEQIERDLYLKGIANGTISGPLVGYPSIDKPWLKVYQDKQIINDIPRMSAYDYLFECNKDRMNKAAINYYGNIFTFNQLKEKIDDTARALVESGVKKGEIVSISLPNIPEVVFLYYALSKIGAVANMIDPRTSKEGIKEYLEETNSRKLFIVDSYYYKANDLIGEKVLDNIVAVSPANYLPNNLKKAFGVKSSIEGLLDPKLKIPKGVKTWEDFYKKGQTSSAEIGDTYYVGRPSLIEHTGGTTGSPKSVLLSDDNINAMAYQSSVFPVDLQSKHKWLDIMPPFIAYGIGSGLHFPLILGMETILVPQLKPNKLDELVLKYKPNHICGAPTHWNYFVKSKKLKNKDLSFLITCAIGGDSISEKAEKRANDFLKAHGCKYGICKGYGMTETNGGICRTTIDNNEIGTVGVPFVKSLVSVFDPETNEELPYNKIGEIRMAGENVMLEYLNKPEQTSKVKVKDVDGYDWIHSGDIGYMNEYGNIFVVNRYKRMIVRHDGFKIFPANVERIVQEHPNVEACCVIGVRDRENNQGYLPYAYVKLSNPNVDINKMEYEINNICLSQLPEYSQLFKIEFVDRIPVTPFGKVDADKLQLMAEQTLDCTQVKSRKLKIFK